MIKILHFLSLESLRFMLTDYNPLGRTQILHCGRDQASYRTAPCRRYALSHPLANGNDWAYR